MGIFEYWECVGIVGTFEIFGPVAKVGPGAKVGLVANLWVEDHAVLQNGPVAKVSNFEYHLGGPAAVRCHGYCTQPNKLSRRVQTVA